LHSVVQVADEQDVDVAVAFGERFVELAFAETVEVGGSDVRKPSPREALNADRVGDDHVAGREYVAEGVPAEVPVAGQTNDRHWG
jgi:hypothetical protein